MSLSLWKIGTHLYHTHLRSVVILFERCYFQWGWRCTKRKSNYGLTGVHRQAPSHKSSTGLSKSVQFYSARKCWNPGGSHIPSLDQYSRRLLDPHVELLSRNCREIRGAKWGVQGAWPIAPRLTRQMSVAAVKRQSSMLRLDTKSLSVSGSSNRAMMRCRFSCRFVLLYERWHVVDHLSRSRPYSLPRIIVVYIAENWMYTVIVWLEKRSKDSQIPFYSSTYQVVRLSYNGVNTHQWNQSLLRKRLWIHSLSVCCIPQ